MHAKHHFFFRYRGDIEISFIIAHIQLADTFKAPSFIFIDSDSFDDHLASVCVASSLGKLLDDYGSYEKIFKFDFDS